MAATRKKKATGNHPPTTTIGTRNTPTPHPPVDPILPTTLTTPPAPGRYTRANPQSANVIPSDTTEWDPSMVSPTKIDPSYKPTTVVSNPGYDLRSGWNSSPPKPGVFPQRQKLAHHTGNQKEENSIGSLSTIMEGPAVGMFPTKPSDSNIHRTHLYPIPLSFSRHSDQKADPSARLTNSSSTGMTRRFEKSTLGTDTTPTLSTAAPKLVRRMTRSSTLVQPEPPRLTQAPVETAWTLERRLEGSVGVQDLAGQLAGTTSQQPTQEQKTRKNRVTREKSQALATGRKERKNTGPRASAEPHRPPSRYPTASSTRALVNEPYPKHLERIAVGLSADANEAPKYIERIAANPQVTIDQVPKHLERITDNNQKRSLGYLQPTADDKCGVPGLERGPGSELIAEKPSIGHVPKHLERITTKPPVAVGHVSTDEESAESILWATPTSSPIFISSSPEDPTNPSVGTTRPGSESPGGFDGMGPSWIFMQSCGDPGPEQSAMALGTMPELITPSVSSTRSDDIFMGEPNSSEGRVSGSTATSYSQRAGSPTSLIFMYKVHANVRLDKRKGISLLHTKRAYDGEKELLDLDMPELGGGSLMETQELEELMDKMMNGERDVEVRLASVDRDWENRRQCSAAPGSC